MSKACVSTKEALMEAAIQLIWKSSYSAVGISEICEKAGVTKGCFYHYFDSKATLFYEAAHYCCQQMEPEIQAIFSSSKSALQQLEELIAFIITRQEALSTPEMPVAGCPLLGAAAQFTPEEQKVQQAIKEATEQAIAHKVTLVRKLLEEGYLAETVVPEQTACLLHEFIMGVLLHSRSYQDLGILNRDLRQGIWRILTLKPEYQR